MSTKSSTFHSPTAVVNELINDSTYDVVKSVADNIDHILAINTAIAEGVFDAADVVILEPLRTSIITVAGISTEIASIVADKATLDSIYADKLTLDSIVTDKAILDSLFNDKLTLDSIYADKATFDSLLADKATLDSLLADKLTLDGIFAQKLKIDTVFSQMPAIIAVELQLANIATVAGISADVQAVSGIKLDVVSVAAISTDIATVALNDTNVTNVGSNIAAINGIHARLTEIISLYTDKAVLDSLYADKITLDTIYADSVVINAVNANEANINAVNANKINIDIVATNIANVILTGTNIASVVTTAADIASINSVAADTIPINSLHTDKVTLDSIYADKITIDAVHANKTNIDSAVANETDISTVAGSITNINTVASIQNLEDITTVADDLNSLDLNGIADVTVVANDLVLGASSSINKTSTNMPDINTNATNIASINTVASNIADINNFGEVYFGSQAVAPTIISHPNLSEGDLYFDTALNEMRVFDGSIWKNAGSTVNGTSKRQSFLSANAQTIFTVTNGYEPNYADVYRNGRKLTNGVDVDISSGTTFTLTTPTVLNDEIDFIGYGTFLLADHYSKVEADALLTNKADQTSLTTHTGDITNPHSVTKAQVGLTNADDTSDLEKPISTATQTALDAKVDDTQIGTSGAKLPLLDGINTWSNTQTFNAPVTIGAVDGGDTLLISASAGSGASLEGAQINLQKPGTTNLTANPYLDIYTNRFRLLGTVGGPSFGLEGDWTADTIKWNSNNIFHAGNLTIENLLTSTSTTNALSAAQGKALKDLVDTSGGATGGGGDKVFHENDQIITTDYTLTAGKNAISAGTITINDGVTVTIPDGATWVIG